MILADCNIKEYLKKGFIEIEPFSEKNLQPASYDLTLGYHFIFFEPNKSHKVDVIDVKDPYSLSHVKREILLSKNEKDKGLIIPPKTFVLATTIEKIYINEKVSAIISGRSSIGRLGLFIENAGWVDSGFKGQITLELFNANDIPIRIYPEMRICQIIFLENKTACENPYNGKYQNQELTTISRIYKDFEEIEKILKERFKL
jgi:dCTP deaminase